MAAVSTAMPSAGRPTWDEEVVPRLRRRLEAESQTLTRRISQLSDNSHTSPTPEPSLLPEQPNLEMPLARPSHQPHNCLPLPIPISIPHKSSSASTSPSGSGLAATSPNLSKIPVPRSGFTSSSSPPTSTGPAFPSSIPSGSGGSGGRKVSGSAVKGSGWGMAVPTGKMNGVGGGSGRESGNSSARARTKSSPMQVNAARFSPNPNAAVGGPVKGKMKIGSPITKGGVDGLPKAGSSTNTSTPIRIPLPKTRSPSGSQLAAGAAGAGKSGLAHSKKGGSLSSSPVGSVPGTPPVGLLVNGSNARQGSVNSLLATGAGLGLGSEVNTSRTSLDNADLQLHLSRSLSDTSISDNFSGNGSGGGGSNGLSLQPTRSITQEPPPFIVDRSMLETEEGMNQLKKQLSVHAGLGVGGQGGQDMLVEGSALERDLEVEARRAEDLRIAERGYDLEQERMRLEFSDNEVEDDAAREEDQADRERELVGSSDFAEGRKRAQSLGMMTQASRSGIPKSVAMVRGATGSKSNGSTSSSGSGPSTPQARLIKGEKTAPHSDPPARKPGTAPGGPTSRGMKKGSSGMSRSGSRGGSHTGRRVISNSESSTKMVHSASTTSTRTEYPPEAYLIPYIPQRKIPEGVNPEDMPVPALARKLELERLEREGIAGEELIQAWGADGRPLAVKLGGREGREQGEVEVPTVPGMFDYDASKEKHFTISDYTHFPTPTSDDDLHHALERENIPPPNQPQTSARMPNFSRPDPHRCNSPSSHGSSDLAQLEGYPPAGLDRSSPSGSIPRQLKTQPSYHSISGGERNLAPSVTVAHGIFHTDIGPSSPAPFTTGHQMIPVPATQERPRELRPSVSKRSLNDTQGQGLGAGSGAGMGRKGSILRKPSFNRLGRSSPGSGGSEGEKGRSPQSGLGGQAQGQGQGQVSQNLRISALNTNANTSSGPGGTHGEKDRRWDPSVLGSPGPAVSGVKNERTTLPAGGGAGRGGMKKDDGHGKEGCCACVIM